MSTPSPPPRSLRNADFSNLEPHGERRRRQLVRAAAHIVEYEGIEALRMPRVAELAGCTRTLVYRYFPSTDDLLIGVASEYYAALDERIDRAAGQRTARSDRSNADRGANAFETSLRMLDAVFDVVAELGLAGLMLRGSPHLSEAMRAYVTQRSQRFSEHWVGPIRRSGISMLHAGLVTEAGIALLVELVHRWQSNEISREEAMSLSRTCFLALLHALQDSDVK